jgi:hypothetical protein
MGPRSDLSFVRLAPLPPFFPLSSHSKRYHSTRVFGLIVFKTPHLARSHRGLTIQNRNHVRCLPVPLRRTASKTSPRKILITAGNRPTPPTIRLETLPLGILDPNSLFRRFSSSSNRQPNHRCLFHNPRLHRLLHRRRLLSRPDVHPPLPESPCLNLSRRSMPWPPPCRPRKSRFLNPPRICPPVGTKTGRACR